MATATLLGALCLLMACGDRCERICRETSFRLEACAPARWTELGARNRSDFVVQCRNEWDRRSSELTGSNLSEALEVCGDARETVETLGCEEVVSLYFP